MNHRPTELPNNRTVEGDVSKETLLEKSDFLPTPPIGIEPKTLDVVKYGKLGRQAPLGSAVHAST